MTIHVARLVCNVTVSGASDGTSGGTIQRAMEAVESTTTGQSSTAGSASGSGQIDPRVLADRVYRLMRRDLELARERE